MRADECDPIETATVLAGLGDAARQRIEIIEYFTEIESTNRYLLEREPPAAGVARVAIAEYQTAGRGRRGRRWVMSPGTGLALSLAWRFGQAPSDLSALSLAVGAAVRRAVGDATGLDTGLKWPNDLMIDGGKVGGILVELDRPACGACHVVAGIGINVRVPRDALPGMSDLGARDLAGASPDRPIERSSLAARLIERLVELFSGFAETGFAPYLDEWLGAHVLADRLIEIRSGASLGRGIVRGIAPDGALIVESDDGERQRVIVGDVTIREHGHARD
jgi:BirA family biotin operon repressor/biotin-[acetyl-CoA-carboxylase] ligase